MDLSAYFASLNLLNLLSRMPAAVAQGLIWGLMALGVFVTFRLLDIADLTVDGSFATGGAVTVMLLLAGWPAWAALLAAILAGVLTGLCTGWLHTKLGIPAILAGILTQFSLYSINLRIMAGKANQTASIKKFGMFWDAESGGRGLLVSSLHIPQAIAVGAVLAVLVIGLFYWYFGTEQGSALRATGSNPAMSRAQGIHIETMKVIGLGLSNGMVALAGGLMTQYQGTADVNMGRGAIVIGLAAIIIGEVLCDAIFKKRLQFCRPSGVCGAWRRDLLRRHGHYPLAPARSERPEALHRHYRCDFPCRAAFAGAGQKLLLPREEDEPTGKE